jgi:ergothioneine biosynthesis protein EgtB
MGFLKEHHSGRQEAILSRFGSVRKITEDLCKPLVHEDYVVSATEDTSPPKWHLAHTTWFFENFVLKRINPAYEPYKTEFNFLFNSYYKRLGLYLSKNKRDVLSRPTTAEILQYRQEITKKVMKEVGRLSDDDFENVLDTLELGIHHEQQHQELLLMDIKRNFFENPLRPHYNSEYSHGVLELQDVTWQNIPSGLYKIGVDKNSTDFAFDNEKDSHKQWIESCMISSHLVTNDEYVAFIEEGGYENPLLWLSDGWDYKEREQWSAPLYWEKEGSNWWIFTLGGMVPLDLSAPVVHVSFYEAMAFAKWKGARLPTEYEWETAASMERAESGFLEDANFEPVPSEESFDKFSQIHGTVWEWTQSAYLPYPRYEKFHHGLSEYNEKFMCNQFVLRGGSCVTPSSHYRTTYRNFYYPHMRWHYAGIRLAKDLV